MFPKNFIQANASSLQGEELDFILAFVYQQWFDGIHRPGSPHIPKEALDDSFAEYLRSYLQNDHHDSARAFDRAYGDQLPKLRAIWRQTLAEVQGTST